MSDAQIHDLGYRAYDGPRAGVRGAMTSLGVHAAQRVLGLKRSARHKVMPVLVILISFVPAIIYVGIAAVLPVDLIGEDILPNYSEYYGFIAFAIFLFAAFVAPEALCTDRRTGMLALYLASPLNRTTYIFAKMAAIATVLLAVTMLPETFLLLAYTFEGAGPDGIVEFVETLVRIMIAGVVVSLFFAAFTSAISSVTPRRAVASASIIISILVPLFVTAAVLDTTNIADELSFLAFALVPFRAATFILGEPSTSERGIESVSGALTLVVALGMAAAMAGFTWWRYQRLEVER